MGIPVLILGESGSGKTASLRNFEPDEIGVFSVSSKPLPFRKKLPVIRGANYGSITANWEQAKAKGSLRKVYAIDDSQYLMAFDSFNRQKELGYQKFTDFAVNFYNLLQYVIRILPDDILVYFLHHTETSESGKIKAKTIGKMLDNQLTVEGLFSIVLLCMTDGTRHYFQTQSDGFSTTKSPMDMFETEIDNDLKFVDTRIREYYEFNSNQGKETEEHEET